MTANDRVRVRTFGAPASEAAKHVAAAWPDAEVLGDTSDGDFSAALVWDCDPGELAGFLDAQPALAWLHTTAAGLPPEVLSRLAGREGLTVTNGAGTHGDAVAEHVLALTLAHCKRLPQLFDAQRTSRWQPPVARELRGLRAGIVGLGDLGRATARLLSAFGTEVVGLRRGEGAVAEVSATYRSDQLDAFCEGLDLLVVAAPLTEGTRGLIGRRQLARLQHGAFLVNVGRGPIVDEEALLHAVHTGQLAGAALDVFATEPLPASSALWSTPGVLITPHCADTTAETDRRCLDLVLDNIARYRSGRPLRNVVDPQRGY
ncbi:D-2-hydroxyacid dehydrogenase [Streptomyces sp. NPDC020681]|uniref:D-2-hydroxyacid dehydrogenase n=1 Tax=Streptomyces sp. NPDC020681 TaxID=3365083 RepID=UPI003799398F